MLRYYSWPIYSSNSRTIVLYKLYVLRGLLRICRYLCCPIIFKLSRLYRVCRNTILVNNRSWSFDFVIKTGCELKCKKYGSELDDAFVTLTYFISILY